MSGGLLLAEDDQGPRCHRCGGPAAGPCASCRRMVCGDCSTLTEGGAKVWAICLGCARSRGRSLTPAWRGLLLWLGGLLLALAALTALVGLLAGR